MSGPRQPWTGQDAFGAIQEIVGILEADPNTVWSKANLEILRQHLIDMNQVTLHADAVAKPVDGGLGDRGHRQRAHVGGDTAYGPGARPGNQRLPWLGRQY